MKNNHYTDISNIKTSYQYDYTKCMVMKLFMAQPDKDRKSSQVMMNFEQTLRSVYKELHADRETGC